MRVLVACEFSGRVRDAFLARGHDAWSVDLLSTESTPERHIVGDALEAIETIRPDLLIAHPPCTYLANSGVRWLYGGKGTVVDRDRWAQMEDAAAFFADLLRAHVPRIAVENPIMHGHGREAIERYGAPAALVQTVQPWMFGQGETKATQLYLRNLPPLVATDVVDGRAPVVHYASPGPNRWRERSRTYQGIADAMAAQWGGTVCFGCQGAIPDDATLCPLCGADRSYP